MPLAAPVRPPAALALALALLVPPTAAGAEGPARAEPVARLHLLDGRAASGSLVSFGPEGVEVRPVTGGPLRASLDEVLELDLEAPATEPAPGIRAPAGAPPLVEVELAGGDLLRGPLVRGAGEAGFVVDAGGLGEIEAPLERVRTMRFLAAAGSEELAPLRAEGRHDLFLFRRGDRLEGTLRSVDPKAVRVRTSSGTDRELSPDALAGFALVPLPPPAEKGVRVRIHLRSGSRVSAATVLLEGGTLRVGGMADGRERSVPLAEVEALTVRGGAAGICLADLPPARVEVKPYWGDDPPALAFAPVFDRAFHLDTGAPPPLRAGGRAYARGVSVFSGTTLEYAVGGLGFRRFLARVAVDDGGPRGAVEFEVLLDGKSAWKSGVVRRSEPGTIPATTPVLELGDAKVLALRVHAGPGEDVHDFANWLVPALLR